MKATIKAKYEPHCTVLRDVVPLNTPFGMMLQVSTVCDAKCNYCFHSLPNAAKKERNFNSMLMEMPMVEKIAEQILQFPGRIKKLQILGMGEPLCHPELARVIKIVKSTGKVDRISMATNALSLTYQKTIDILEAGLDNIEFSIQGVNEERYRETCGVTVDFKSFVEKIGFFFQNRNRAGHCYTLVKTVDVALRGKEEREKFFEIFGDICDSIYVENVVPIDGDVKYKDLSETDLFGRDLSKTDNYTCPTLFYLLNIKPNGDVIPCCHLHNPVIGNIESQSLMEIWDGDMRLSMMSMQLKKQTHLISSCKNCNLIKGLNGNFEEDELISCADEILERINRRKEHMKG